MGVLQQFGLLKNTFYTSLFNSSTNNVHEQQCTNMLLFLILSGEFCHFTESHKYFHQILFNVFSLITFCDGNVILNGCLNKRINKTNSYTRTPILIHYKMIIYNCK